MKLKVVAENINGDANYHKQWHNNARLAAEKKFPILLSHLFPEDGKKFPLLRIFFCLICEGLMLGLVWTQFTCWERHHYNCLLNHFDIEFSTSFTVFREFYGIYIDFHIIFKQFLTHKIFG